MKKQISFTCLLLFLVGLSFGQNQNVETTTMTTVLPRNSFYVELGGNAGMISINYERLVPLADRTGLGLRVGIGSADALTGLLEVNFIYGINKHYLETGIGYTNAVDYPDQWVSIKLGYRYQAPKGFLFKIAPMYIYNFEKAKGNDDIFDGIWLGASFGYSF